MQSHFRMVHTNIWDIWSTIFSTLTFSCSPNLEHMHKQVAHGNSSLTSVKESNAYWPSSRHTLLDIRAWRWKQNDQPPIKHILTLRIKRVSNGGGKSLRLLVLLECCFIRVPSSAVLQTCCKTHANLTALTQLCLHKLNSTGSPVNSISLSY